MVRGDLGWPDGGYEDGLLLLLCKSSPDGLPTRVDVNSSESRSNCIGNTPNSTPVVLGFARVASLAGASSPSPFSSFLHLSSLLFFSP